MEQCRREHGAWSSGCRRRSQRWLDLHRSLGSCRCRVTLEWFLEVVSSGHCRWWEVPRAVVIALLGPGFRGLCMLVSITIHSTQVRLSYLFGNNRLPNSFEGEPAPALPGPA